MNKLFAIVTGILVSTSTLKAIDLNIQQSSFQENLTCVAGRSWTSFEDAMNEASRNIPSGFVMASVQYGRNGTEYIVILKIKKI